MRTGPSMVILSTDWWQLLRQERRAIAGRTARCRCKFRYVITYSAVYLRIQKWKNYWNRSTFARVIVKIKVTLFYGPWCSLYCYSTNSLWNGRIKISLRKPNSSFVQFVVFWCHVDQLTVSAVRPATCHWTLLSFFPSCRYFVLFEVTEAVQRWATCSRYSSDDK